MTFINYASRVINCKIVLAGPLGPAKADIARSIYKSVPASDRGKFSSFATEDDPVMFFDFPFAGTVRGFRTRLHLYTLPDAPSYDSSAKKILKGVDGLIFVSDASVSKGTAVSVQTLKGRLAALGYNLKWLPLVTLVYKESDSEIVLAELLKDALGDESVPVFEVSKDNPRDIFESVKELTKRVLQDVIKTT